MERDDRCLMQAACKEASDKGGKLQVGYIRTNAHSLRDRSRSDSDRFSNRDFKSSRTNGRVS